jgi:hypothetical protein
LEDQEVTRRLGKLAAFGVVALVATTGYFIGHQDGFRGSSWLLDEAEASGAAQVATGWSPTGTYPDHEVYFPGTEELGPDEIRVIACGSGMPMPRLKQAASCCEAEGCCLSDSRRSARRVT